VKDNPIQGSLTVAYDGKLVLDRLQSRKTIDLFAAHADLLQACKHILKQIQCQVEFQHVKGHQDKGQPTVLQRNMWLNIEVDLRAKASIETEYMAKVTKMLPMEPLVLTISNQQIVKNHKREIQWALNKPPAQQYWKSKLQLASSTLNDLDTEAIKRALKETHSTQRWWATKQMTGQFAHGKNMM